MNKIGRLVAIVTAFLAAVSAVQGAQVSGLYEASVPVDNQGAEVRRQALRTALEKVLVKVSGYGSIAEEPAINEVLDDAEKYVRQFGYDVNEQGEEGEPQHLLRVDFDSGAVNSILRRHRMPVWGETRPTTLAWVAVEEENRHRLLGATDAGPVSSSLRGFAAERALPLRMPLLDLQDQASVRVADVWGGFEGPVLEASQRYDSQAVLMGRVYRYRGRWNGSWSLFQGGEVMRWQAQAYTLEQVLRGGIDGAADQLSARFAQVFEGGGERVMDMHVADVKSLGDYARMMKYLSSLGGVTAVKVDHVEPDAVLCRLTLEVHADKVAQTITLGSVLSLDGEAGSVPPGSSTARRYRLLR